MRKLETCAYPRGWRTPAPPRRGNRAGLVDLVFDDLDSPWSLEIVRGVEEVAHQAGAGTVVSAIHSRASARRQGVDNIRARATDAVILVMTDLADALHSLGGSGSRDGQRNQRTLIG